MEGYPITPTDNITRLSNLIESLNDDMVKDDELLRIRRISESKMKRSHGISQDMKVGSLPPCIPNLPSRETLEYARISSVNAMINNEPIIPKIILNEEDKDGKVSKEYQNTDEDERILQLIPSDDTIKERLDKNDMTHKSRNDYSSIGSGNLASDSGSSNYIQTRMDIVDVEDAKGEVEKNKKEMRQEEGSEEEEEDMRQSESKEEEKQDKEQDGEKEENEDSYYDDTYEIIVIEDEDDDEIGKENKDEETEETKDKEMKEEKFEEMKETKDEEMKEKENKVLKQEENSEIKKEKEQDILEYQIPPPRNKNRPISRIYFEENERSKEEQEEHEESIQLQTHKDSPSLASESISTVTGSYYSAKSEIDQEANGTKIEYNNDYRYKYRYPSHGDINNKQENEANDDKYLNRPVPNLPLKKDNEKGEKGKNQKASDKAIKDNKAQHQQNIETMTQLMNMTNNTVIGNEFNSINMMNEEKQLLTKLVDNLSRITTDILFDSERKDEYMKRILEATKALEGF